MTRSRSWPRQEIRSSTWRKTTRGERPSSDSGAASRRRGGARPTRLGSGPTGLDEDFSTSASSTPRRRRRGGARRAVRNRRVERRRFSAPRRASLRRRSRARPVRRTPRAPLTRCCASIASLRRNPFARRGSRTWCWVSCWATRAWRPARGTLEFRRDASTGRPPGRATFARDRPGSDGDVFAFCRLAFVSRQFRDCTRAAGPSALAAAPGPVVVRDARPAEHQKGDRACARDASLAATLRWVARGRPDGLVLRGAGAASCRRSLGAVFSVAAPGGRPNVFARETRRRLQDASRAASSGRAPEHFSTRSSARGCS